MNKEALRLDNGYRTFIMRNEVLFGSERLIADYQSNLEWSWFNVALVCKIRF